MTLPAPTLPPPQSPLYRRGGHLPPGLGCQEEVPGPLSVKQLLGPEDASSVAAANAVEVVNNGGGELLVGEGCDNGEELELEPPPPRVQLEEVGWQIPWELLEEPAKEGSPLPPYGPGPMEVDGAKQALEDGAKQAPEDGATQVPEDVAVAGEAMDKETDSLLAHATPS